MVLTLHLLFCCLCTWKTNDICAFDRCSDLFLLLNSLPADYRISADNAYNLSWKVLIPFSGAKVAMDMNRDYNFYLYQLCICIEMAFGLLAPHRKISQIIWVCSKLREYCIWTNWHGMTDMIQVETATTFDPSIIGIAPLTDSANANGNSTFSYLPTWPLDDLVEFRVSDFLCWEKIVAGLLSHQVQCPLYNITCNR